MDVLECLKLLTLILVIFSYLSFQPFQTCSHGKLFQVLPYGKFCVARSLSLREKKNISIFFIVATRCIQVVIFCFCIQFCIIRLTGLDVTSLCLLNGVNTFLKGVYLVICLGHPFLFMQSWFCKEVIFCEIWSIKKENLQRLGQRQIERLFCLIVFFNCCISSSQTHSQLDMFKPSGCCRNFYSKSQKSLSQRGFFFAIIY